MFIKEQLGIENAPFWHYFFNNYELEISMR